MIKLWGGHFDDHRERSTWLRKKACLVSFHENFAEVEIHELQMQPERKIFFRSSLLVLPHYACPTRKNSLATGKKCEWKSGLRVHLHKRCTRFFCQLITKQPHFPQMEVTAVIKNQRIKPWEKVSPILVTLTSRSDSDFERSNFSLKKINLMALIRTLTISTTTFERMKEKFDGFRETVLVVCKCSRLFLNFHAGKGDGHLRKFLQTSLAFLQF